MRFLAGLAIVLVGCSFPTGEFAVVPPDADADVPVVDDRSVEPDGATDVPAMDLPSTDVPGDAGPDRAGMDASSEPAWDAHLAEVQDALSRDAPGVDALEARVDGAIDAPVDQGADRPADVVLDQPTDRGTEAATDVPADSSCGALGGACCPGSAPCRSATQVCADGRCALGCPPGEIECARVCCAYPGAAASCVLGRCVMGDCNARRGNCDGLSANGCETDLTLESSCGSCTRTCSFRYECICLGTASCSCRPVL